MSTCTISVPEVWCGMVFCPTYTAVNDCDFHIYMNHQNLFGGPPVVYFALDLPAYTVYTCSPEDGSATTAAGGKIRCRRSELSTHAQQNLLFLVHSAIILLLYTTRPHREW